MYRTTCFPSGELANSMVKLFVSGDVMKHICVTMEEILVGTVIGIVIGLILGYIMAKILLY